MVTFQIRSCPGSVFSFDTFSSSTMRDQIGVLVAKRIMQHERDRLGTCNSCKRGVNRCDWLIEMPIGTYDR